MGSTLAVLEAYPAGWAIDENWRPRPDVSDVAQLAAFLAEETARQFSIGAGLEVICLRLGRVVDDGAIAEQPYDPRWLHVADATEAVHRAVHARLPAPHQGAAGAPGRGWWVYHIPGGGPAPRIPLAAARDEHTLGYTPKHSLAGAASPGASRGATGGQTAGDLSVLGPRAHVASRPIRNVVIFGAGGPLAAATAPVLTPSYRLRLTDLRDIAEIVTEGRPQDPGAPLPRVLDAPHEMLRVDVTDAGQVLAACAGMDAVINCTVLREHPVEAFRVNLLGAYHIMRAAIAQGIRRVVHTGPQLTAGWPGSYRGDFAVPDDAPPRPGTALYALTKYLGQEVVRLFAEAYDLQAAVLVFYAFVDPATAAPEAGIVPMAVSWEDAGHALRGALEAAVFPSPCEVFHILTDLPHGMYSNAKARHLLNWSPRDSLAHLWAAGPEGRERGAM
jgi:nucleoside-diphosphate-sugar epimerase